jgi:hypothetical protein
MTLTGAFLFLRAVFPEKRNQNLFELTTVGALLDYTHHCPTAPATVGVLTPLIMV